MFVGYVRVPQFAVAVARREDARLAGQPLILVDEPAERATVYAACRDAVACGVRPGMTLGRAERLCPQARLAPAVESAYLAAFEACLETLGLFAPTVEPEVLGCAYLELDDVAGPPEGVALFRQLGRRLQQEQGLTAAMGVTTTMFGAAVAGLHMRPGFALTLPAGVERGFLAPFPSAVLPVSDEMVRRLQLLGLREVGQYADLPAGVILNQFGWEGQRAHRLAQGRDERQVQPERPRLIETARRRFEDPIADAAVLARVRDRLVAELVARVGPRYVAPQAVHVRLGFEDGSTREARVVLPAPVVEEGRLQRAAGRLTEQVAVRCRVTEIEVSVGLLQPLVGRQLTLLPTQADRERQFRRVLDNLIRRYGRDGFRRPQVVDAGALVLERRFVLNRWCAEG